MKKISMFLLFSLLPSLALAGGPKSVDADSGGLGILVGVVFLFLFAALCVAGMVTSPNGENDRR